MASAYASASDVAPNHTNILDGGSAFSASTHPKLSSVNIWLQNGFSIINTALEKCGYDTPVASTAGIFENLRHLNTIFASAYVEFSRTNIVLGPNERTRGQIYLDQFWSDKGGVGALCKGDLSKSGVNVSSAGKLYTGGISKSDKNTQQSDSDRVRPKFFKDMMRNEGELVPTDSTSGS